MSRSHTFLPAAAFIAFFLVLPQFASAALSCSVTFDENPTTAEDGTTIHWTSSDAEWFYINGIGYVSGSGSVLVQPSETRNYDGSVGLETENENAGAILGTYATQGVQTFTVPAGVSLISVKMWGAGGEAGYSSGGGGGYTSALVAVTPGETLQVVVGANNGTSGGGASWLGGGVGGGYSALSRGSISASNALVVAGGGGGGGYGGGASAAGAGGGLTGQTGYGHGGTQTAGGAGANPTDPNGAAFRGGDAGCPYGGNGPCLLPAGGGGSGWYGGGGAHSGQVWGGGGGGGSGYCSGQGVSSCSSMVGNYSTPGNSSDADRPSAAALGGSGNGFVIIRDATGGLSEEVECPATLIVSTDEATAGGSAQCPLGYTWTPGGSSGSTESESQTFNSSGTFEVPSYESLTVEVWGGGGGGADACYNSPVVFLSNIARDGGQSSFNDSVIARGGGHGYVWCQESSVAGGSGGSANGGDTNLSGTAGESGANANSCDGGSGGSAPYGGAGGEGGSSYAQNNPCLVSDDGSSGFAPGAGGGGGTAYGMDGPGNIAGGGGGSGGYSKKTYEVGELTPGSSRQIVVGLGGAGGAPNGVVNSGRGGNGAPGRVTITWTPTGSSSGGSGDSSGSSGSGSGGGGGGAAGQCVYSGCPTGYTLQGSQCNFIGCPTGYTLEGGQCVSDTEGTGQCTATFFCSGADQYERDDQCEETFVETCAYGCSGGGCLPMPPPSGNIWAVPGLVQLGDTTQIMWSTQNTVSCEVAENNSTINDVWTNSPGSHTSGVHTSSALDRETVYALSCTGTNGSTFTDEVTVKINPRFQEL